MGKRPVFFRHDLKHTEKQALIELKNEISNKNSILTEVDVFGNNLSKPATPVKPFELTFF